MRTISILGSLLCTLVLLSGGAQAQESSKALDLVSTGKWKFVNGAEFPPGGQGSTEMSKEPGMAYAILNYDFTAGGSYVAALRGVMIETGYAELRFRLQADRPLSVGLRLIDATGQTHQYAMSYSSVSQWQPVRAKLTGKAPHTFGGKNDGVIYYPIKQIMVIVERRGVDEPGALKFGDFKLIR